MDKKVCVGILLAMLATAALCKPMEEPKLERRDLLASLSHEQRQLIRSLPQLLAAMSDAEGIRSMHDRDDYTGWMDFGRRSSED